jgi:hypothetical protein
MKNLGRGGPDRDNVLEQCIPGICAEWIPDDGGNTWHLERTAYIDDRTFVLVRSDPGDVGSDRFAVLVDFDPGAQIFTAHAMYSQDEESTFGLLSTASSYPEDVPSVVVW